jgi:hypothetical protein
VLVLAQGALVYDGPPDGRAPLDAAGSPALREEIA